MSKLRISVRSFMIAIAIFAVLGCCVIMRRRSNEYNYSALLYESLEADCLQRVAIADVGVLFTKNRISEEGDLPTWREQLQWWLEQSNRSEELAQDYHNLMAKYKYATRHPWTYMPYPQKPPSPDPLLPPPDLPLKFTTDPKTLERSPL